MANQKSSLHDFSNKIGPVTGGTGVFGRSITQAFVESNATVISTYVNDRETSQGSELNQLYN